MSPGLGSTSIVRSQRLKFQTIPAGSFWADPVSSAFKVTSPDVEGEKAGCR